MLQLVLLPFYLKLLGIEAYALVGLYVMLITTVQVFDLGLAQTLNRELARLSAAPQTAGDARDLVRTLELVYWAMVIVICALLLLASPWIAAHALNSATLPPATLSLAISLMVVVIAMQWPANLYASGLMGLQRQVLVNVLRVAVSTIGGLGALLVLWLVSPTIVAFFCWQAVVGFISLACQAYALHASLPRSPRPTRFRLDLLKSVWRFAAGMTGLTISALLLTQLDKWILIKLLPLEAFGYFTLAVTVANSLNLLVTPFFSAVFPRFSSLIVTGDQRTLVSVYHLTTQTVSAFLWPLAIFLALFSREVLLLWTHNPEIARHSGPLLSLLVIGTALNGLSHIPYAWVLARGRTGFIVVMNSVAIVILAPAIWFLAGRYGAIAAAALWVALNVGYLIVFVPMAHRDLSPADRLHWFTHDVGLPLVISALVLGAARFALSDNLGNLALAAYLGSALAVSLAAAVSASPGTRTVLHQMWLRYSSAANRKGAL